MSEENKPPAPPPAPKGNSNKMIRVDLVNNTRATQSIDAGDETHTRIVLAVGETKSRVEVAEWVAKELRKRARNPHPSHQLVVYDAGKAPAPKPQSDEDEDDGEDDAE